jgi:hypothetical protein
MAPLLILITEHSSGELVVTRRARLRERVAARLLARRLDQELARGAAPETRAALALRAEALGEPARRRALASQLRRVLSDARHGPVPHIARIPVQAGQVLVAADALDELAERLLAPGPVAASGLAQVRLLLSDGRSPLFWREAPEDLRDLAARALEDLEPAFQW